jgi:hypothetical protein
MFVSRQQFLKLSAGALTAAVPGSPLILTPSHPGTQAANAGKESHIPARPHDGRSPMPNVGYHASPEQFRPSELLNYVRGPNRQGLAWRCPRITSIPGASSRATAALPGLGLAQPCRRPSSHSAWCPPPDIDIIRPCLHRRAPRWQKYSRSVLGLVGERRGLERAYHRRTMAD